jgi:hypothetical protein
MTDQTDHPLTKEELRKELLEQLLDLNVDEAKSVLAHMTGYDPYGIERSFRSGVYEILRRRQRPSGDPDLGA